jgi:XTP/dITP diphosphohydrolase
VCALALVDPSGGQSQMFFGQCRGRLAERVSGLGGFGYDPAFLPDQGDYGDRTMAELSDAEKDRISHRGNAVRSLLDWIRDAP